MRTSEESTLLRVDHDAALAKLAWSQLQGTWQLPAELARLAIGSGATSVEVEITPHRLALTAPGARLERPTVGAFATVLDGGQESSERHNAMIELEERDAFVLAAIACLDVKHLRMRIGGEAGTRLDVDRGGELRVSHPGAPPAGDLELAFEGPAIEAGKAVEWLSRVGRFAPVPIAVNTDPIDGGFDQPLIRQHREIPPASGTSASLPVELAIPWRGSAPRLWLLRHGIISTRATVPGFPAFEAAIEMAPVAGPEASAAMLRERLDPYIQKLIDDAVGLTLRLGESAATLSESNRARTARLLLEAALKHRRRNEVTRTEIFPLAGAEGRRLVHIDEISRRVRVERGGTCALDAVPPGRDPREFSLAGRPALVLSEAERVLLGELLQVVFSAPPAPLRRPLRRRLADLVTHRGGFGRGTAVDEAELSDDERDFLSQLRTALTSDGAATGVAFHDGRARALRTADGTLLVPRQDPTVHAAVRAVGRDPAWLYPTVAFLLGGREMPGPELRRRWPGRRVSSS